MTAIDEFQIALVNKLFHAVSNGKITPTVATLVIEMSSQIAAGMRELYAPPKERDPLRIKAILNGDILPTSEEAPYYMGDGWRAL